MAWPGFPYVFSALAFMLGTLLSGCSLQTQYSLASVLFEGVPPPGTEEPPKPFARQPRRPPPYPPPKAAKAPLPAPEPEKLRPNWRKVLLQLPKDAAGGIDWVRALEEKLIEPQPGLDSKATSQPVFDLNIELIPKGQPMFKVAFPHKAHTEWLTCASCHPSIFKMQRGADPITMAKIFAGEYCGRCHGKVAFPVPTGCPRCHLALAGKR